MRISVSGATLAARSVFEVDDLIGGRQQRTVTAPQLRVLVEESTVEAVSARRCQNVVAAEGIQMLTIGVKVRGHGNGAGRDYPAAQIHSRKEDVGHRGQCWKVALALRGVAYPQCGRRRRAGLHRPTGERAFGKTHVVQISPHRQVLTTAARDLPRWRRSWWYRLGV